MGAVYAVIGAALAATLAGIGSSYGVQAAGKAAAGVTAEKPELFSKLFILQLLPATQGIYGLISAIVILIKAGILGGDYASLTPDKGLIYLFAALPIAIVGLLSGIYQGKTAASSILMTGKQPDLQAKGIQMTAVVETYAIFALVATIIIVLMV
ncbi:MAG: V-type ATP synthase subunit K [Clostridia bacterium]|nr:V-type ATP synthase subunit K [Clostridia bacterium]MBQ3869343.1 V-type ATP synthase subunit K [Clostridia bacterium]